MNIPVIFWLIPVAAVAALLSAACFYRNMKRQDEGTERMRAIAGHVRQGAMAYLRQQYKVVGIVFLVLALLFKLVGAKKVMRFFPPIVTGPIIILIGLNLSGTAVTNASTCWWLALVAIAIIINIYRNLRHIQVKDLKKLKW